MRAVNKIAYLEGFPRYAKDARSLGERRTGGEGKVSTAKWKCRQTYASLIMPRDQDLGGSDSQLLGDFFNLQRG
jgi:hypothetical protein